MNAPQIIFLAIPEKLETRNWKLEKQKVYQYIAQFQVSGIKCNHS